MEFKLLKGDQVAELLNISRSQAYGMMKRGEIQIIRFGKCVRVKEEDLIRFLDQNKVASNYRSNPDLFNVPDER